MDQRKTILQTFLVNNESLELLEAKLDEFNPFSILKIDAYENKHSYVLAWLLDPNGNHNFGEKILKKILSEIIVMNEGKELEINVPWVNASDFHDAIVYRESISNIDILLVSEKSKFVLLIENKINAGESEGQLKKYLEFVKKRYPTYEILPVFLTLSGEEPVGDKRYCVFSHEALYDILKFNLRLHKENMNSKVFDFIRHYLKTLWVLTMKDEEISNLCKKIYKQHKNAIDLIVANATSSFEAPIEKFISKNKTIKELDRTGTSFWFLPEEFSKSVPKVSDEWAEYPFAYWFSKYEKEDRLGLILEVGPFNDSNKRIEFMNALQEGGFKIREGSLKPESTYSRIFTKYIKFDEWEDIDKTAEKMDDLYNDKAKEANKKIGVVLKKFNWK